ncbi:MAG: NYN domain-containing protein [Acidobacteriota bacterium]|nr:NYN domain-containing protein [Acidobacteriota bacterium]
MSSTKCERVYALVDGFNLYHALQRFDHGVGEEEQAKYQRYKWLCLRTLVEQFLIAGEVLAGVHYFTAYPNWDEPKRLRHQTYVKALAARGVEYTLGEFKPKFVQCRAACRQMFDMKEEKQTDVNIATKILEMADEYDHLILITADSDQVPAVRLLLRKYPAKRVSILPPIGRNSKELVHAAGNHRMIMREEDLRTAILPNPVEWTREGKSTVQIWKPAEWKTPDSI